MAKFEPTTELEKSIAEILGSAASAKRVAALVEMIEARADENPWIREDETISVKGARVAVEHVEVHGLRIGVDANGNAATIDSDYGLEIVP